MFVFFTIKYGGVSGDVSLTPMIQNYDKEFKACGSLWIQSYLPRNYDWGPRGLAAPSQTVCGSIGNIVQYLIVIRITMIILKYIQYDSGYRK